MFLLALSPILWLVLALVSCRADNFFGGGHGRLEHGERTGD